MSILLASPSLASAGVVPPTIAGVVPPTIAGVVPPTIAGIVTPTISCQQSAAQFLARAQQNVATSWGQAIAARLSQQCLALSTLVPNEPGGWIHDFQSPDDHDFLVYNAASATLHQSRTGKQYGSPALDAAWRVLRHRELADAAATAAMLGQILQRPDLLEVSRSILLQYATHYPNFQAAKSAQPWMLKGRAFQQALTEALWFVPIARAYILLQETLGLEERNKIEQQLLRPSLETLLLAQEELILHQGKTSSNFNAWLIAAIANGAIALQDQPSLERILYGQYSLEEHLAVGVLADGFAWEGSLYYHNFVALAYSQTLEMLEYAGVAAFQRFGATLAKVWNVLPQATWENGDLMQRRDGSYWVSGPLRQEYAQTLEMAYARSQDSRYAHVLRQLCPAEQRPWTALAFGRALPPHTITPANSVLFNDSGLAVLRNNSFAASLEFGDHGGAHGHFDKLSLHFAAHGFAWSHDPGSPPYGSGIHRAYHQTTAAHNTIVVDGGNQLESAGHCVSFSNQQVHLTANQVYTGVKYTRSIQLHHDQLSDQVNLESEEQHLYDWFFHGRGSLTLLNGMTTNATPLATTGMYQHIMVHEKKVLPAGRWSAEFLSHQQSLILTGTSDQAIELLACCAPNTDAAPWKTRPVLIIRCLTKNWRLETHFRAYLID